MTSEVRAQDEIEIWLPDPAEFLDQIPDDVRRGVHLGMPGSPGQGDLARGGPNPIGVVPLGELSTLNPADYASRTIRVRIFSPWGYFPPYRIWGRLVSTSSGGARGDLRPEDVGLGVTGVRARRPQINPLFQYDPRTVGKDIDDVPLFLGTIGGLSTTVPRTLLYRTGSYSGGRYNSFTLVFAVGPQFFSPNGIEDMAIELAITIG